ncbi:mitochondrial rpoD precursor, putative [Plasmodium relictum]|uniref:Mitochondrial rpoD, putative n=1 Tax=Plasmodium relictum TaxID=85471 RepID=A0A1J1H6L0_PLARL|nr:mitochondrial rpoD precursor, putative [Plasmodium relictum]CRH00180.1 mitochondrial rpoD precursor, putative [Plasmodium relictum]
MKYLLKRKNIKLITCNNFYKLCCFYCSNEKKISNIFENTKLTTKNYLIQHENDIINILQYSLRNKNEITAQSIVLLLKSCSKNKYINHKVANLIVKHIKYNIENFSIIKLCICLNYIVNLNIKNEESFNYLVTNSLIKKLKNDEDLDLYGVCMITKFLINEKIKNEELLYFLLNLTKNRLDKNSNHYDIYNLIISFLNMQNSVLNNNNNICSKEVSNNLFNKSIVYTEFLNKDSINGVVNNSNLKSINNDYIKNNYKNNYRNVAKLNEEVIHKLLFYYIKLENIKNEEIILIVNNLTNVKKGYFFYEMNLNKNERTLLYEIYLNKLNYKEKFGGKILALLLFNLQKIFRLNEISEEKFYNILENINNDFRFVALCTKETTQKELEKQKRELEQKENVNNNFLKQNENEKRIKSVQINEGKNNHRENFVETCNKINTNYTNKIRMYFSIQEIGMVFQFYDFLQSYEREKKKMKNFLQDFKNKTEKDNILNKKNNLNDFKLINKSKKLQNNYKSVVVDTERISNKNYCGIFEVYINILKKSLFFYSLHNRKEKMNILDFCTVFKGFSKIYKNSYLDKYILLFFLKFIILNQNKIKINELKIIFKLIFEKKNEDFFEIVYNTKNVFSCLQNILIKNLLSEKRTKNENIVSFIMCFYYLSFLNFNSNTYFILNNFILKNIRNSNVNALIPYIIISKFNYYKLRKKLSKESIKVEPIRNYKNINSKCILNDLQRKRNINDEESNNETVYNVIEKNIENNEEKNNKKEASLEFKDNLDDINRIPILYKLINRNFNNYKTYYVLNCVYMLIKFLKEKNTFLFFSNCNFPDLFEKLHNKLSNQTLICKNYDYFINYAKYNYCISFFNYYINLNNLLEKLQFNMKFPYNFYTPFNTYMLAHFLMDYKNHLMNNSFHLDKNSHNYIDNKSFKRIMNEKMIVFHNFMKHINSYNFLNIHDIINMIKTIKFFSSKLSHSNFIILHNLTINLEFYKYTKISTIFELLIEYIKFMYYLELENQKTFEKCNYLIVNVFIFLFRIVFKNILRNLENNYIGMLYLSFLYIFYFIQKSNYIFHALSLNNLNQINYYINLKYMTLDKYEQTYSFQLHILEVLKGIVKNKRMIINEYNIYDTPYTVDILIK